jgi:hypothetical protein
MTLSAPRSAPPQAHTLAAAVVGVDELNFGLFPAPGDLRDTPSSARLRTPPEAAKLHANTGSMS